MVLSKTLLVSLDYLLAVVQAASVFVVNNRCVAHCFACS